MDKNIVVFDVDGIILDFNKAFCNYMKSNHHIDIVYNPRSWDYEWKNDPHILDNYINEFINTKPFIQLFDNGICRFINTLKMNYKIIIVTVYSNNNNRCNNLKQFNIYYDDIYFANQHNKAAIINSLNPYAVFEDCPDHINNLLKTNNSVTIFTPDFWNYTRYINNDRIVRYANCDSIMRYFFK